MKLQVISVSDHKILEEEMNKLDIVRIHSISAHPMYNAYPDGQICNQWTEYIAVVEVAP